MDADDLPRAISIRGDYEISGNGSITVDLHLRRDGKELATRIILGKKTEADKLVQAATP